MNKLEARDRSLLWLSQLLCRRYTAGFFGASSVEVLAADEAPNQTVHWALALCGGDCEVLGAWSQTGAGLASPAGVFADLEIRGVERIRFLVGPGPVGVMGGPLPVRGLGAAVLPSIERSLLATLTEVGPRHRVALASLLRAVAAAGKGEAVAEAMASVELKPWGERYPQALSQWRVLMAQWAPVFALPPPQRRAVLAGDQMAAELHGSLSRAIARHSPFDDSSEALDFVANRLQRAERRLDGGPFAAAPAVPRARRGGLVAQAAASGF